jgi:hypothetical protein
MIVNSDYNDIWNWNTDYYNMAPGNIGPNDIHENPLFINSAVYNFHLSEGSGCIDAGDNDAVGVPSVDFDGNNRPVDGNDDMISVVDMGAFEFGTEYLIYIPLFLRY